MLFFVLCWVYNPCFLHSFSALDAGATGATLDRIPFVAAPGVCVVDTELLAMSGYLTLC